MTRRALLIVAFLAQLAPELARAQVEIRTRPRNQRDHYAWVTQLESGGHVSVPVESRDSARSRRFRLAVLTSEISNTFLIEEVRYGVEGCCARVASVREVDLGAIARHFRMRGEQAGARILRSLSPTSFRISLQGRTFDLSNIDRPTITVTEVSDLAQQTPPRFMYIHRDSLKHGVDYAYHAIEVDAAQICADFKCPNPYLALESLRGPHEAWWLNAFASEADTARVGNAYAANRPLIEALGAIAKRKATLIGKPIAGFGVYRPDLSRGPWSVAGARFMVVTTTRSRRPVDGAVWQTADSTLYVFRPVRTFQQAETLAREKDARIFAVRPIWSMPAPEWVAADPEFWRLAPVPMAKR